MSHDAKLLHDRALAYHEKPVPGKIKIEITKPAETADDLTLAYSPGVAEPKIQRTHIAIQVRATLLLLSQTVLQF